MKFVIFEVLIEVSMKITSAKLRRVVWYVEVFRWNPLNRCSRIRAALFSAASGIEQIRGFTFLETNPLLESRKCSCTGKQSVLHSLTAC